MHCCRPHRARRLVHKARAPFRGPGSMGSHPQGRTNTNPRDTERPQRHENQQKGPRKKRRAVRGCPRPSPSTSLKRSARACGARAALALYREGPGLDCKILLEAKKNSKNAQKWHLPMSVVVATVPVFVIFAGASPAFGCAALHCV